MSFEGVIVRLLLIVAITNEPSCPFCQDHQPWADLDHGLLGAGHLANESLWIWIMGLLWLKEPYRLLALLHSTITAYSPFLHLQKPFISISHSLPVLNK